jgi:hypothetical protein
MRLFTIPLQTQYCICRGDTPRARNNTFEPNQPMDNYSLPRWSGSWRWSDERKIAPLRGFCWSFFEFGMDALCHEEFWAPAAIIRTDTTKKIGMQVISYRVAEMFHKERDIFIQGVTLEMGLQLFRLFAHLQLLLADAPALAEMTGSKGHSGLKNCGVCMNGTNPRPPGGATPMHEFMHFVFQPPNAITRNSANIQTDHYEISIADSVRCNAQKPLENSST